jgi:hypothetical protein
MLATPLSAPCPARCEWRIADRLDLDDLWLPARSHQDSMVAPVQKAQ